MSGFLRTSSVILLVIAILCVLVGSIAIMVQNFFIGFLYLILGIFVAIFYIGFIFLFLDMSENVEYIKFKISDIDRRKEVNKQEEIKDGWKCEECGKVNRSYTTTCTCGKTK